VRRVEGSFDETERDLNTSYVIFCTPSPPYLVRNFPTHGQLSAAQGSPTYNCLSAFDIRLI
jgi:hypothetical protein